MNKTYKKIANIVTGFLLVLALLLPYPVFAAEWAAADTAKLRASIEGTAEYMLKAVPEAVVASTGGEWAVFGLARSGAKVPDSYYRSYYANVEKYVAERKGVLHDKKYTEYSRLIVALTSIGKDPRNVAGYNILKPLGDYENVVWQGLNGPIWALIALDCGSYEVPTSPAFERQATRQMYVNRILQDQLPGGGWSFAGTGEGIAFEADITGMALQALAPYKNWPEVKDAIEKALARISKEQKASGGFEFGGVVNVESTAQVIVGLCELGIDIEDSRFVKSDKGLLENLMSFRMEDGGFRHVLGAEGGNNQMASEQSLYAMAALLRAKTGKNNLYNMKDAVKIAEPVPPSGEVLTKDPAVKIPSVSVNDIEFVDMEGFSEAEAVKSLASRGIINGKGEGKFAPYASITRAEFATIVVRALGLSAQYVGTFSDVSAEDWHASYVAAAEKYGIVKGVGGGRFNPNGIITRQQAATIVARAAKLCGMKTELSEQDIIDILSQFGDYIKVESWAKSSVAFCYKEKILDGSALQIEPAKASLRGEVAVMLFNMLKAAKLI